MSEDVKINVLTYKGGKGTLTIHATGVSPEDCNASFTKKGQAITLIAPTCPSVQRTLISFAWFQDIQFDKSCLSGASVTAKYCSDTDTISLIVQPDQLPLKVPATLSKAAC